MRACAMYLQQMGKRSDNLMEINRTLAENNSCYVLITCGNPSQDGEMKVDLKYWGDPVQAAYLVESALNIIETDISS
jgi:hypothetical protein